MLKLDFLKESSLVRASLIITTVAALVSISTSLSAAPEHQGAHCERVHMREPQGAMGMGRMPRLLHQLDLTEAQKDKVFAIIYPTMPQMREQHKAHHQLMQEMMATSQADQFDEKKAQAIADKLATLEKQKVLERARIDSKIIALLTPEQKIKLKQLADNPGQSYAEADMPPPEEPIHFKRTHQDHHAVKVM